MTTRAECSTRIVRLQDILGKQQLDGALITHPIDVYYFTGTCQNGVFWVPASGDVVLMVRKSLTSARAVAAIVVVLPFPSSKEFAGTLPPEVQSLRNRSLDIRAILNAACNSTRRSLLNRNLSSRDWVWSVSKTRLSSARTEGSDSPR